MALPGRRKGARPAARARARRRGVPSRTLASLEHAWSEGAAHLHPRSVLLLDEAGMIDVRRLGRILAHADERGAKVVLLGDPDQLKAIGAGDAFRGLLEQHPSARIDAIRRQHEPWQREASEHLAGGRVASALDSYEEAGRLHWADTRAAAQADLLRAYVAPKTTVWAIASDANNMRAARIQGTALWRERGVRVQVEGSEPVCTAPADIGEVVELLWLEQSPSDEPFPITRIRP